MIESIVIGAIGGIVGSLVVLLIKWICQNAI